MQCDSCNNYFKRSEENPDRYLCYTCKSVSDDEDSNSNWTKAEDRALIRFVKMYGERWGVISKKLKNRNFLECKERWQNINQSLSKQKTKFVEIKGNWTREEDEKLVELAEKYGGKKWTLIATQIPGRKAKQCRERYVNHLKSNLKKTPWSSQEDQLIVQYHKMLGNQWAKIARMLPGRSDNSVKNRWNATLSKKFGKNQDQDVD
jgi:hypothetical protein